MNNNEEKLPKVNINWYPRSHGENEKTNFRRFKIN